MKVTRPDRQVRTMACSYRADDQDGKPVIEGYFAVFGGQYELWRGATESIAPTAFDGALDDDIRCLTDHDTRLVLGRNRAGTLTLRVDERGLWGRVEINTADTDAMNLYARVKRGDVSQCSFGFEILDEETTYREDGSVHYTIKRVKLYEVSVVTFPAYRDTQVEARAAQAAREKERRAAECRERCMRRLKKC